LKLSSHPDINNRSGLNITGQKCSPNHCIQSECDDTISYLPVNIYISIPLWPCLHRHYTWSVCCMRQCNEKTDSHRAR